MNIDQPLEDVIKAKRQERRGARKNSAPGKRTGGAARKGGAKALAQGSKNVPPSRVVAKNKDGVALNEDSKKVIVSNLPTDVNEPQLKVSINIQFTRSRLLTPRNRN